tara:strand:- start:780 stop:1202 length:423 start_codon:yes stop_codon:yes gene_type:complete
MKKNILISILSFTFASFLYSGTIQPSLSMRFNDVVNTNNDIEDEAFTTALVLGLAMTIEEGVSAGFDSDGEDSRIFVAFDYGTFGMGMNSAGEPQFTVGAKYSALSNLDVSLDYVINNLTDDGDGVAFPNELRVSLGVTF